MKSYEPLLQNVILIGCQKVEKHLKLITEQSGSEAQMNQSSKSNTKQGSDEQMWHPWRNVWFRKQHVSTRVCPISTPERLWQQSVLSHYFENSVLCSNVSTILKLQCEAMHAAIKWLAYAQHFPKAVVLFIFLCICHSSLNANPLDLKIQNSGNQSILSSKIWRTKTNSFHLQYFTTQHLFWILAR